MKYSLLILLACLSLMNSNAQAPQGIPYQSVIRNGSGALLINQSVHLRFSIHDSTMLGTVVYQEIHTVTTSNLGMVAVVIGQGAPLTGSFSAVHWGSGSKFMQVELNAAGGSNYTDLGTQQMMSVPYALHAGNGLPNGNNIGDILSWNGYQWVSTSISTIQQTPTLATLTTTAISAITNTTASSGGSISIDGGAAVTANGVCWSTSINPMIALSTKTIDGSGTGSFTSNITGLVAGTTYYVRAYATNSVGTAYGNQVVFTTALPPIIGSSYQGGILAYILLPGDPGYDANVQHGLIAAPSDQSSGAAWGCFGTTISGADGTAIGTGNQNTIDIMNGCSTPGIAARLCGDLVLNGYSDWYLPSKDELKKLYLNQAAIGGGGFGSNNNYWSSSEDGEYTAWVRGFNPYMESYFNDGKYANYYVRAVRAF